MEEFSNASDKMILKDLKEAAKKPFGIKDKIGYMFGDFGNDFFFIMASSFLMVFYTDVLEINPSIVGVLFLVARCVDAFTDIGMGRIVDNAKLTKEGRYRPWIRRMMFPVAFAGLLMFIPWMKHTPLALRIVYIFVTYILWGSFCYTGINIPYGSMANALTDDPVQRTGLSTFRSVGAALAGVLVGSVTPLIVYDNIDGARVVNGNKVFMVACVFAVLAIICYMLCYKLTTERVFVENAATEKQSFGSLFKALITNKALASLILAAIVLLLVMLMSQTMNQYLYKDYFKNISAMSIAGVIGTGVTLVLAPFASKIAEKFGKKEASSFGLILSGVVYALLFAFPVTNAWLFICFYILGSLGIGIFNLMVWAFVSDVIDYQTVRTGSNDGGTIYGVYSFSRKIGQALAGGLGGFMLSMIGYVGGQAQQTPEVATAIYKVATGFPAVGYFIIAAILIFFYPLSKKKVQEVKTQLNAMQHHEVVEAEEK